MIKARAFLASCFLLAFLACSPPPVKTVRSAKTAIRRAAAARADTFAPEAMAAARKADLALDAEVSRQTKRFFKNYHAVERAAARCALLAEDARRKAETGREKAMLAAESAVVEADVALTEAQWRLEHGDPSTLAAARGALEEARSAMAEERYFQALSKAREARTLAEKSPSPPSTPPQGQPSNRR